MSSIFVAQFFSVLSFFFSYQYMWLIRIYSKLYKMFCVTKCLCLHTTRWKKLHALCLWFHYLCNCYFFFSVIERKFSQKDIPGSATRMKHFFQVYSPWAHILFSPTLVCILILHIFVSSTRNHNVEEHEFLTVIMIQELEMSSDKTSDSITQTAT